MLIQKKDIPEGLRKCPIWLFTKKKIFYLLFFESIFCSLFMSTCGLPSMSGLCKLLSDCANLVKGQCTDKSGMT